MPTYVYACQTCEHRFEIFQSFSDKALRTCPECRERSLQKVLFPARVGFKGPGFYVTDSRAAASTSTSGGSSSGGSSSGGSTSKTSETKSSDSKTPTGSQSKAASSD